MACCIDVAIPIVGQKHNPPAAQPQPPRRRRGIMCALLALAGIGLLVFAGSMLALQPDHPVVTLSAATMTNFHPSRSSQELSGDIYLDLSVRNPNHRISVQHNSVTSAVRYGYSGAPLSEVRLPSFNQPPSSTRELSVKLSPRAASVGSEKFKWIKHNLEGSGTTTFDVDFSTRMTYKPWSWWGLAAGRTHILCEDVTVWFPFPEEAHNAGSTIGPQTNCKVTRSSWWWW